eukprot:1753342-Amphidinium_carterae.2
MQWTGCLGTGMHWSEGVGSSCQVGGTVVCDCLPANHSRKKTKCHRCVALHKCEPLGPSQLLVLISITCKEPMPAVRGKHAGHSLKLTPLEFSLDYHGGSWVVLDLRAAPCVVQPING